MISYPEFREWVLAHGIDSDLCTSIEIVHASVAQKRDALMYLRAEQVIQDDNGQIVVDDMKREALTRVITVPMVSLP